MRDSVSAPLSIFLAVSVYNLLWILRLLSVAEFSCVGIFRPASLLLVDFFLFIYLLIARNLELIKVLHIDNAALYVAEWIKYILNVARWCMQHSPWVLSSDLSSGLGQFNWWSKAKELSTHLFA